MLFIDFQKKIDDGDDVVDDGNEDIYEDDDNSDDDAALVFILSVFIWDLQCKSHFNRKMVFRVTIYKGLNSSAASDCFPS